MHHATM